MSQSDKLPVLRDVRVKRNAGTTDSKPQAVVKMPNRVTVMGFDKDDVVFMSDNAGTVQWRDSEGEIVALLVRLRPDVWGFSRKGDSDWDENIKIYGNPNF